MDRNISAAGKSDARTKAHSSSDCRILLIGKAGTGKSSTGNTILGKHEFKTSLLRQSTRKCDIRKVTKRMQWETLTVVDTPGLDTDIDTLEDYGKVLGEFTELMPQGPHIIILVLSTGRFTEEDELTINYFLRVFGKDDVYSRLIFLFTRKSLLDDDDIDIDIFVQNETPRGLKNVVDRCGHYIAFENKGLPQNKETDVKKLFELIANIMKKHGNESYSCDIFSKMNEQESRILSQQTEFVAAKEEIPLQEMTPQSTVNHIIQGLNKLRIGLTWIYEKVSRSSREAGHKQETP